MYKIIINDNQYTSWDILNTDTQNMSILNVNPFLDKLFNNDTFYIVDDQVKISTSPVRHSMSLPCVLILAGNKTYGRNAKGKMLYRCDPYDSRLPSFLVPYDIKNVGFSKVFDNLYVTIAFNEWTSKHPIGTLSCVIGEVSNLHHFYEYQLYCKDLNISMNRLNKDVASAIKNISSADNNADGFMKLINTKYPNIENRTNHKNWKVYTIDPENSTDLDDGFSINYVSKDIALLSIYISNVSILLDVLNIWDSCSRRVSTIYLPDKKRSMLPAMLSDHLASLLENTTRITFCMDTYIDINTNTIVDIKYKNAFINVYKNYHYEDKKLLKNTDYKEALQICKNLLEKGKYKYMDSINDSHDMVAYLMMLMNHQSAQKMLGEKMGIFKNNINKQNVKPPDNINSDVSKFVQIISNSTGKYVNGVDIRDVSEVRHDMLGLDAYIQITSPIRRLVDLLNMIKMQEMIYPKMLSAKASAFYSYWVSDLEYINKNMKSIRKVQNDTNLLELCSNSSEILNKSYVGYIFEVDKKSKDMYRYSVYLPELKMSSYVSVPEEYQMYEQKSVRLFLFHNEAKFKRKIRLQFVSDKDDTNEML